MENTFSQKRSEAERVINWGESTYITSKSSILWITEEQFANKIIEKSNWFIELYTELENEKDIAISELSNLIFII